MVTFEVADMTCGHCVSTITQAVRSVDPGAVVQADVATHQVQIQSNDVGADQIAAAIAEAGYTPVAITTAAVLPDAAPRRACCCG